MTLESHTPNKIVLKVKTLTHFKGSLPAYESISASGFDVRAQVEKDYRLKPFERTLIPTGLVFEIPSGFELQVRPRSGLSFKKGLGIINSPGTIDQDYRGEIKIIVVNFSNEDLVIIDQQRIAQIILAPVFQATLVHVDQVSDTKRGEDGFGSTGV